MWIRTISGWKWFKAKQSTQGMWMIDHDKIEENE